MDKITAIFSLFRQGQSVADPALWKKRQVSATVLGGVIVAAVNAAAAFGVNVPVNVDTANLIAGALIGVVNVVLTYTTSDKVGF